jgi:hypothetical protein
VLFFPDEEMRPERRRGSGVSNDVDAARLRAGMARLSSDQRDSETDKSRGD